MYSDCWVEDSRLVALNALDAAERGADDPRPHEGSLARAATATPGAPTLEDARPARRREVRARVLVNAAGPWVADVLNAKLGLNTQKSVRLVKGSHIVVPKLFEGDHAFILQNRDKRIVFAIPYQGRFTLVGTTDVPVETGPGKAAIGDEEVRYLCDADQPRLQARDRRPRDVVWTYSGVRPLFDDGSIEASAVTRDYVFDLDHAGRQAPVLSIFGGKITTFRKLAEHALDELKPFFPGMKPAWTETADAAGRRHAGRGFRALPGGPSSARRPFLPEGSPAASRGPTARGSTSSWRARGPWPISARISAAG